MSGTLLVDITAAVAHLHVLSPHTWGNVAKTCILSALAVKSA